MSNSFRFVASNKTSGSLMRFGTHLSESSVEALGLAKIYCHMFDNESPKITPLVPEQVLTTEALIREIEGEIDSQQAGSDSMVTAKLAELLVAIYRFSSIEPQQVEAAPSSDVWSIYRAIKYVQERYDESFSLIEIANRCAINTTSFSREFKRITGSPLFEYVNKIRIQKACILLKRSRKTVLEIAMEVGYNNVSFFNRYFKKIMGMSPTTYRAAVRR